MLPMFLRKRLLNWVSPRQATTLAALDSSTTDWSSVRLLKYSSENSLYLANLSKMRWWDTMGLIFFKLEIDLMSLQDQLNRCLVPHYPWRLIVKCCTILYTYMLNIRSSQGKWEFTYLPALLKYSCKHKSPLWY